jgi:hypothetical protein
MIGDHRDLHCDIYPRWLNPLRRECLSIVTAQGVQPAWVYIANPAFRQEGLLPSADYLAHLLAGQQWLSEPYWSALAGWPVHPD